MRAFLFAFLLCSLFAPVVSAQLDLAIESFDGSGNLEFDRVTNAVSYRVEWAPTADGPWTNFATASTALDFIPAEGSGMITASVPMLYRVVASVITSPAPAGMSLIPAGWFEMGDTFDEDSPDELPVHTVFLNAFYMDQYEVTKALWDEVKAHNGGNGYGYENVGLVKATDHPVHTVDWFDAVKWCNARSEMEGLTPVYYTDESFTTVYKTNAIVPYANWSANGYRLPTEAEWEKAARGGVAGQRFPWGDTISHGNANYYANPALFGYDVNPSNEFHTAFNDDTFPYTNPVGYFTPNGYGLYDMAGNVFELCWDWFSSDYYSISPSTSPLGPSTGFYRVLRGGSWYDYAERARIAERYSVVPGFEGDYVGFRCAKGL